MPVMRTYFESLEALLRDFPVVVPVALVRDAMIDDQHRMFHDATWEDGCPICDEERINE